MMSLLSRQEYIRQKSLGYIKASPAEKSVILDDVVRTLGCHRKYAVHLMLHPPKARSQPIRRPRAKVYDQAVCSALKVIWEASGEICSKRFVPGIASMLEAMERHCEIELSPSVRQRLLSLSPATADRLLHGVRCSRDPHGVTATKPGTLLRKQIAVRTSFGWDEQMPGYVEADLVAHCGESGQGNFLYTLTLTDIATGWTECEPLLNKGRDATVEAIERVRQRLPFELLGIDTDNGSEFINYHIMRYCQRYNIHLTRCRPYHKNDQCHVEQKNGSVVRRHVGYDRLEGEQAAQDLKRVYVWLCRHINFFQPSMKLVSKQRDDGKVTKRYDTAATPFQRLTQQRLALKENAEDMQQCFLGTNPCDLLRQLRKAKDRLRTKSKVISTREATITLR